MAERKGADCRTCDSSRTGSRKRLRCSHEEEQEVAEILTSLRLANVKERQLGMTKRIKQEVMCINAELDEWAARQPFIDYTCEETAAEYAAKGAALMQRLDTCDRDLQFVHKMARWK